MIDTPCFILTCNGRESQLSRTTSSLSKYFSNIVIFNNVVTEQSNSLAYSKWRDPWFGTVMREGEINCAIGHIEIWKQMIKEKHEFSFIFEDDVEVCDESFFSLFSIDNIPCHDLLYLCRKKVTNEEEEESQGFKVAKYSYWTNAYILSLKGANKILDTNYGQDDTLIPVDEFLSILFDPSIRELLKDVIPTSYIYVDDNPFIALATVNNVASPLKDAFLSSKIARSPFIPIKDGCKVITVASEETDGYKRFIHSCCVYGYSPVVLGLKEEWRGGNLSLNTGGAQKIILLRGYLDSCKTLKDDEIIIFSDSYDVVVTTSPREVLEKYGKYNRDIVFASELYCWPNQSLSRKYPIVKERNRYLNSGCFIGKVGYIREILQDSLYLKPDDDDQLFYTLKFLNDESNNNKKITLDYLCNIFQCNLQDTKLELDVERSRVRNTEKGTTPCFIHGNGVIQNKIVLNSLSNYLLCNWTTSYGGCDSNEPIQPSSNFTLIYIIDDGTCSTLKHMVDSNVFNKVYILHPYRHSFKEIITKSFIQCIPFETGCEFKAIVTALKLLVNASDVLISRSSCYHPDPSCIFPPLLSRSSKDIVAPLVRKKGTAFSNFWGSVNKDGWYETSHDYTLIVEQKRRGVWNVPFIRSEFVIRERKLNQVVSILSTSEKSRFGWDMEICERLRKKGVFMFLENSIDCQSFILPQPSEYKTEWDREYFNMRNIWKDKYISPNFNLLLSSQVNKWRDTVKEVASNVFLFDLLTPEACDYLVETAEAAKQWSGGIHEKGTFDERIKNVENHPTVDVHLKQLGLHESWKHFTESYLSQVAATLFDDTPTKEVNISFIVKYEPAGQRSLDAHHDASTYTIDIALNDPVDYEGGGVRYIRTNETVSTLFTKGKAIIHPGRMTHKHEGLPITKGKRYVLVTFVL